MTLFVNCPPRRCGIAMTEYLIILAIVAIAAISVIGLFGKQMKSVFTRNNRALVGQVEEPDLATAEKGRTNVIADHMGTFSRVLTNQ
jgi:Flp pilus assembly pilin Flp